MTPPLPAPSRPSKMTQTFLPSLLHPFLKLDELNVQLAQLLLVFLALERRNVGLFAFAFLVSYLVHIQSPASCQRFASSHVRKKPISPGRPCRPIHDHCLQAVALGLQVVAPELKGLQRSPNQGARPSFFQIIERAPFIRAQRIRETHDQNFLVAFHCSCPELSEHPPLYLGNLFGRDCDWLHQRLDKFLARLFGYDLNRRLSTPWPSRSASRSCATR